MANKSYRALTTIDYVSTRTGKYVRVEKGDEFDDMNSLGVRNELDHGNIEEVEVNDDRAGS
jgi:hypothetical protein